MEALVEPLEVLTLLTILQHYHTTNTSGLLASMPTAVLPALVPAMSQTTSSLDIHTKLPKIPYRVSTNQETMIDIHFMLK